MPDDLQAHWKSFRKRFTTRTHDTSEHAYDYIYGMLTMDKERCFAGISQRVLGEDGQSLQHFMSESPWQGQALFQTIQDEVCQTATLAKGSYLVLDESVDEKAGAKSAGVSRQYNSHLGKVDLCQVAVLLGYVNWQSGPWTSWACRNCLLKRLAVKSLIIWSIVLVLKPVVYAIGQKPKYHLNLRMSNYSAQ